MSLARISFSGSSRHAVEEFLHLLAPGVEQTICAEGADGDVICEVPGSELEVIYVALEREARRAWDDPAANDLFEFAAVSLPHSATEWYPVRRLRGSVEARLARKKESLPPAQSLPSRVFGTSEDGGLLK